MVVVVVGQTMLLNWNTRLRHLVVVVVVVRMIIMIRTIPNEMAVIVTVDVWSTHWIDSEWVIVVTLRSTMIRKDPYHHHHCRSDRVGMIQYWNGDW